MSRLTVQKSTMEIPQLFLDPQIKENFKKLCAALTNGISFEYVGHLVQPTLLSQQSGSYEFKIKLQPAQADELARGLEKVIRDDGSEVIHYNTRVLVRMCVLQDGIAKIDRFPTNMSMRVNGVFYIMRVDQQYHDVLHGSDVAVTSTEFSLTCPLSQKRFVIPAQGENCSHLSCFDLKVYLKINSHKGRWLCPICNNKVLAPQLVVDGYWKNVLSQLAREGNITTVNIDSRGNWTPKNSDPNVECALDESVDLEHIEISHK